METFSTLSEECFDSQMKYTAYIIYLACLASIWATYFTNPGKLTEQSSKEEVEKAVARYKYDNALFISDEICDLCNIVKPARSHTCH